MNRFREVFKTGPAVLPVIHVAGLQQAIDNVRVASEAGSDGAFLINHRMSSGQFLSICETVVRNFSDFWIGINCLDLNAEEVFRQILLREVLMDSLGGLWVDNPMVDERLKKHPEAEEINELRQEFSCLYFGGVAFKYQREVFDLERAAKVAARYMDVVTTSGPGTGLAADVKKISRMKSALSERPLAIASGITPENVRQYLGLADCFLVATGISRDFKNLDPAKLGLLIEKAKNGTR